MEGIPPTETIEVSDHYLRSMYFLNTCRATGQSLDGYNWNLLASVYSARAIIEIVRTSLESGILGGGHEQFMEDAAANVHRFKLIEVLRVHDFHRSPVRLMPGRMSFHGPVRAITGAQTGSIAGLMQNPETGKIEAVKNRNANVSFNRPLQTNGLNVLDPTSDEWVTADQAVQDYIISLRAFLCARFPSMVEWLPKIELQESPNA